VKLFTKQKLAEAKPPTERLKLRWDVLLKDLGFLAYVALAHFIVWRTVRRRCRENSVRRKKFNLLRSENSLAQTEPQVVRAVDWRISAVATGIGARAATASCKEGG